MNITDLRALPEDATVAADVCIVGSGPAGLTLATELDGLGLKIVLLESGDLARNAWAESMDEVVSVGVPRVLETGEDRNRVLGGTSATWGGRVTPLGDMDFRERDWVPGSGWPITRQSLMPYYRRAAVHLRMSIVDPNDALDVFASYIPPPDNEALVPTSGATACTTPGAQTSCGSVLGHLRCRYLTSNALSTRPSLTLTPMKLDV